MSKTPQAMFVMFAAVAGALSCARGQTASTSTLGRTDDPNVQRSAPATNVLATVNGTAIREADVQFALNRPGHDKSIPSEHKKNILEVIIQRELVRQQATELGLDANAKYREKLSRLEARINDFKRKELSKLFWREMASRVNISQAEAKAYYTRNAARIRSEVHVWQLLWRDEASAKRAESDLKAGTSFATIARARFSKLAKTSDTPWNLGYLRWKQVPEPWQHALQEMAIGDVSDVISGPNNRFWIIKLIDRRENPDITFENIRPTIIEVLKNAKIESLHEQINRDLRAKASIVYPANRSASAIERLEE